MQYDPPYHYDDPRLLYDERCFFYDGYGYDDVCLAQPDVVTTETKRRVGGSGGSSSSATAVAPAVVRHTFKEIIRDPGPDLLEIDIFSKVLTVNKESYQGNMMGDTLSWKGIVDTSTKVKVKEILVNENRNKKKKEISVKVSNILVNEKKIVINVDNILVEQNLLKTKDKKNNE